MVNGGSVLHEVDVRLAELQREASAAQTEADRLAAQREGLRSDEAEALRELARLRLKELADGRAAVDALDAAGDQLRETLARRARELDAAQRAVLDARDALAAAEARRDAEVETNRAAQEAEASALKEAEAKAAQDADFQRLSTAAEEAERIAQHAEQKAGFAARDFEEKGKPYRADPLFAYLWDRGWGTGRYRAFPLVRMIDGWVARLIEFEPARRSYALLAELPGSMTGHAARMRADADAAVRVLVERRRALAGLPVGGSRIDPAALDAAEDTVEAARAALTAAEAKRSALASGEDPASQEAIRALEAAIGQRSLRTLREEAARTPTRDDDAIVARLEITGAERVRLENTLADAQAHSQAARHRLVELQSLRQEMRSRGVERSDWGFASGALVGALVTELLRGALSRDGFWDRLERQRLPDQMGGTSQPGPWGNPLPGPWGRPAPGPWATKQSPSGGGWWDEGNPQIGSGGIKGGGWDTGGSSSSSGGFTTGGTSDSGGGFRTGGSV
ncbi:hypothetical protein GXW78_25100 [Roseomonas terrae]|jgi:uncharacterized membrane protein YgcG|uniref:Uncharacterized protein n=1 Tax=Neoroseomonas terrae TaxID=424799 RepID=A0ABS5EPN3_9PROT|nr:hypothetical protein [Neoroseomonas terrae]MBR0652957.1 hypothetical protein [Neoroseomonas terrae]